MTTDMARLSIIFLVAFPSGLIFGSVGPTAALIYSVALTAQYLVVAASARNYGIRFVLAVLADESQATGV